MLEEFQVAALAVPVFGIRMKRSNKTEISRQAVGRPLEGS